MKDEPCAPGQVWQSKAWPSALYCLLFLDEERSGGDCEVWAALDLETAELRDISFNTLVPTKNVRVA